MQSGGSMKRLVASDPDERAMRFARTVFTCAGIWGLAVLTPLYFSFDLVGRFYPPAITHPDFFYGFVGVSIAWQIGFLLIGRDPTGLHMMMIPAILEKFGYVVTLSVLYAQDSLRLGQFVVAVPDFVLGLLFVVAFLQLEAARRFPELVLDYSGLFGDR
jgi:hypothetical protein